MKTWPSRAIDSNQAPQYYPANMRRFLGLFVYQQDKSCPRCGSSHVHRTRRGRLIEYWVLELLPARPYRCGKCRLRFYGPKHYPPDPENKETWTT